MRNLEIECENWYRPDPCYGHACIRSIIGHAVVRVGKDEQQFTPRNIHVNHRPKANIYVHRTNISSLTQILTVKYW